MIICRSCRSAWPDSAHYCGMCKRSFHGRRCPKGHLSPKSATFCLACGSKDLSLAAESTSFGCASRAVAWIVALFLLKVAWPLLAMCAGAVLAAFDWLFGLLFGISASELFWQLASTTFTLVVLTCVFALLVPGFRKNLPGLLRSGWRLGCSFWRLSRPTIKFAFRQLKTLFQGDHHDHHKRKTEHQELRAPRP
ncbi:MAG: zinc ribbon domain-containing protein [Armatimonadetes bacterium]|nr:zinc ribbon domain-containing protein [Armatimonadota bacterium]